MKRRWMLLLSALILFFLIPAPTLAARKPSVEVLVADPLTCVGYPEPRTFLEVQSWWKEPGIAERMHLHAGTCFPLVQNMSGTSTFDVRVMLHKNPGTLFAMSFDFLNGSSDDCTYNGINDCYMNVPDVTCGIGNDCTYWYTLTVNWSSVPAGWQELRLKPRVRFPPAFDTDPGATQITSAGWPVQVRSGTGGYRSGCNNIANVCEAQFRGWYEGDGYANVAPRRARDFIPQPTWSGATRTEPWRIYNNTPNGEDEPLTDAECYIDPDFHNPNWVPNPFWTYSGPFPFNGNITAPLTGLASGPHRWACIAYSDQTGTETPGELAGVGALPFTRP